MSLLLQLNGAITESPHERMFYVFACKEKACRRKGGSVRALRGVKVAAAFDEREKNQLEERKEEGKEKEALLGAGEMLFGSGKLFPATPAAGQNPFSTAGENPFSAAGANPFSAAGGNPFSTVAPPPPPPTAALPKSFADSLRISSPSPAAPQDPDPPFYGAPEPWPSPLPHQYPLFYLDADYETLVPDRPRAAQKVTQLLESDDTPVSNSDADDGVLDTAFQSFADRVGQNPEQVLRYERGGTPLLYSYDDAVAKTLLAEGKFSARRLPACAGCSKRARLFEFQLMPHAITVLEGDSPGLDGMEWGTIVVATCTCPPKIRDANGVGWMEEWVGVQWEAQK